VLFHANIFGEKTAGPRNSSVSSTVHTIQQMFCT